MGWRELPPPLRERLLLGQRRVQRAGAVLVIVIAIGIVWTMIRIGTTGT